MNLAIKNAHEKVIGLKQTLRAIQQDKIEKIFYAADIEEHIIRKLSDACCDKNVPMIPARMDQKELGRLCQIEVGAAVVGLLK